MCWPNRQPENPFRRITPTHCPRHARLCFAGLVLLRQRPGTAKGITFVTIEDEMGTMNLVLHLKVWEQNYQVARRSPAWIAHGRLEREEAVIHVVARRLENLSEKLRDHYVDLARFSVMNNDNVFLTRQHAELFQ